MSFLPRPVIFTNAYDPLIADKVVLTDLASAQAVITGMVSDPNEWKNPEFTQTFIDLLTARLKAALAMSAPPPGRPGGVQHDPAG